MVNKLEKKLNKTEDDIKSLFSDLDIKDKVKFFEHLYNPQHIYCRIRDLGFTKEQARVYENSYEEWFYTPIIKQIKRKINK